MDGLEWKTLLKWMIWGYHYFRKHPYATCLEILDVHFALVYNIVGPSCRTEGPCVSCALKACCRDVFTTSKEGKLLFVFVLKIRIKHY